MSSKKELIYHAVIEHIKKEGLLANIKVAQIAKDADIGKGTIYEYFTSKEEIITETIIYMIENTKNKINYDINHKFDFEKNLKLYIKQVAEMLTENMPFHTLLMSQNISGLISQNNILKIKKNIFGLRRNYQEYLQIILDLGFKEGKFKKVEDEFIIHAISHTIFSSIVYYINIDKRSNIVSLDDLIDKIYDLIFKMLS